MFFVRVVLFFILSILVFGTLQAQQFKSFYNLTEFKNESDLDSVLPRFEYAYKQALLKKDTLKLVKALVNLSVCKRNNLDYNSAFNDAGDALFLAEEYDNDLLKSEAFEELGVLTYLYKQDVEAGENFKKAHLYLKKALKNKKGNIERLYQSHYNLALFYQRTENKIELKAQIDSCRSLSLELNDDLLKSVFLDEKQSSIEERAGRNSVALELLKKSASILEDLDAAEFNNKVLKSFLIIVYGRIGNIYMGEGRLSLAKSYFNKSIVIDDICGEGVFYKAFVYSKYADLLGSQNNYKVAFEYRKKASFIIDTYLNPRNDRNQGFLTIKNRYKDQLANKNELLSKQSLELAERKQEALRFRILLFIVLFIFVVLSFLVRSRIRSLRHQKKEDDSKALLDVKNSELTVSTLQLIEREEVIKMLSDHVKKINLDNSTQTLLKSIEKRSVSLWDAFNNRFITQNEGFYERLQEKVPGLSAADLKVCALIKLNFSGKEMAHLLGISLGSVHVARHRLRKKMNLSRDVNLTNFINSI